MGPMLPTDTPTVTPTLTATPASAGLDFSFAICGDSRDNPGIYRQVLASVMADGSEFLISLPLPSHATTAKPPAGAGYRAGR